MLGQHPSLYSFPELNLFLSDRLSDLINWDSQTGPLHGSYLSGLRRAVAQLEYGEQSAAALASSNHWLSQRCAWSTTEVFNWLLERVQPCTGLDKSPRTAMARQSLSRALSMFPSGRYIHLTRHPFCALQSLLALVNEKGSHVNRFYAQLWCETQQAVLELTRKLPERQVMQLRGEDLLGSPEHSLRRITSWLGITTDAVSVERMKHPERSPYAYVIPGYFHADNDIDFLHNPNLRAIETPPDLHTLRTLNLGAELTEKVIETGYVLGYA